MKIGRYIIRACLLCTLAVSLAFGVYATKAYALQLRDDADDLKPVRVLYVNGDTALYEKADEHSAVLQQLHALVMVVELEAGETWTKVKQGDLTGYVRTACIQVDSPDPAVAKEIEDLAEYDEVYVNEVIRLTKEKRHSKIYGIMILVVIAVIFAVGIISTVVQQKKEKQLKHAGNKK